MLYLDGFMGLLVVGVWIFCFIDVVLTPVTACRNLPKLAWIFIVLLLPTIGSIAWLVAGHPWDKTGASVGSKPGLRFPNATRPNRVVPSNPDDDEEFLASLKARAEEQRRRAREASDREPDGPVDPA